MHMTIVMVPFIVSRKIILFSARSWNLEGFKSIIGWSLLHQGEEGQWKPGIISVTP